MSLRLGEDATELIDDLIQKQFNNASNGFWFANVLLEFGQYQQADLILSQTIDKTLISMQRSYGPDYWEILEDGIVDVKLLDGMMQMVCLNRSFSKRDESVIEDHLSDLLKDEQRKVFYEALKKMQFSKQEVVKSGFSETNKILLEDLNLKGFYK